MWKQLIARIVSGSILLFTGVSGLTRVGGELGASETLLQHLVGVGVLGYGLSGSVAALLLLIRHRHTLAAAVVWAVFATATGTLAPVAFASASPGVALSSGLMSGAVAAAVAWLAAYGLRPDGVPAGPRAA